MKNKKTTLVEMGKDQLINKLTAKKLKNVKGGTGCDGGRLCNPSCGGGSCRSQCSSCVPCKD